MSPSARIVIRVIGGQSSAGTEIVCMLLEGPPT